MVVKHSKKVRICSAAKKFGGSGHKPQSHEVLKDRQGDDSSLTFDNLTRFRRFHTE